MIKRRNVIAGLGGVAMAPMFLQSLCGEEASTNETRSWSASCSPAAMTG